MGLNLSSLWEGSGGAKPTKNYTITMVGLDGAGKTTILGKLKRNEAPDVVPTIGFNVETIPLTDNVNLCIMDIGGQDRIRDLWKHYYDGCHVRTQIYFFFFFD
jgi:small GTP-binding protein